MSDYKNDPMKRLVYKHDVMIALAENIDEPIDFVEALKNVPIVDIDELIKKADEDIGKTCYKIYVKFPRYNKSGYYDFFCDTTRALNYWLNNETDRLYIRERPFVKSDRVHLGKTVFWTREEAERAIRVENRETNGH